MPNGNAVYVRLAVYVMSTALGLIPAAWANWVYVQDGWVHVSIEGAATAVVAGAAASLAVFGLWGKK